MILAFETATNVCSVVFCNDRNQLFEKRTERRGSHSEQLFLFIEELQQEHGFAIPELDAVLVSEGPGSYTGLRISASAAKGLLFQTEVPLYGVNTLASFAGSAVSHHPEAQTIHSIIDARRVHIYHQQFTIDADGALSSNDTVEVIPIEAFETMVHSGDTIIGTGLERIDEAVLDKTATFGKESITAASLIKLYKSLPSAFVEEVNPEFFDPNYYSSNQVS
ncbi:MAG TPA: tRNA (adenosine(37)-N6)-threonylcarbamoyltransferase complex dimerization subunit type 1 TsaB [Fodinibius sp.]|nr:tRNA (adenosine(37)-N6)-threonylcarbamoyltransferase complex dimerization subunit type 1 TsaB [Fodinibius sp.]